MTTTTERDRPVEDDWLTGEPRTDELGQARLSMKLGRLHCSFCVATIEKALSRRDGVELRPWRWCPTCVAVSVAS